MNIRIWIGVMALFLATPSVAITTTYLQYNVSSGSFNGSMLFDDFLSPGFSGGDVSSYLVAWTFNYGGYTADEITHPSLHSGNVFDVDSWGIHEESYICVNITGDCRPSSNSPAESVGFTAGGYAGLDEQYWFQPHRGLTENSVTVSGPTVIPVPAAVWLFGSGLLGLVGIARRKKTA